MDLEAYTEHSYFKIEVYADNLLPKEPTDMPINSFNKKMYKIIN